jgi:hypothetical protein
MNAPSILERENKVRHVEPKSGIQDVVAPEVIDLPKPNQPEKSSEPPKPKEPPPGWLKPYLEDDKDTKAGDLIELDPSPSDKTSSKLEYTRFRR